MDSLTGAAHSIVDNDPFANTVKGFVKGGMKTVGGLLHIVSNYGANGPEPSDVIDYQSAHPGASYDEANAAVTNPTNPYRGPNSQHAVNDLKESADWLDKHSQTHGFFQGVGNVGEGIAEFMTPEALAALGGANDALKAGEVVTKAEKLKQAAKTADILKNNPTLAKFAAVGLRTVKAAATAGVGGGVQTYVKTGGDAQQAETAAGLGAATGGIVTPLAEAGSAAISHIMPSIENIGGVELPRLASQSEYPTTAQGIAGTAEQSNATQQAQQAAGSKIISNAAKGAAEGNLGEVNELRTDPASAPGLPATATTNEPYTFRIQPQAESVEHGSQVGQAIDNPSSVGPARMSGAPEVGTSSVTRGPELATQDSAVARETLGRLNDAIEGDDFADMPPEQQKALTDQREDLQQQMGEYHAQRAANQPDLYDHQPRFAPVNIPQAVAKVGSFGDAADAVENSAKDVYDRLDDLTDGKFTRLREQNKAAWNAVSNGGGDAAEAKLAKTQAEMNSLLSGKDGQVGKSVNDVDLSNANEAWKKAQVLRDVHSKVEASFDTALGTSDRANAYRGFNGNRLRANLKSLTDSYGERPLIRVIGQDNFDNLTKLADITRTQSDRSAFGGGVNNVAGWLVKHEGSVLTGAAAAGGTVGHLFGGEAGAAAGAATAAGLYRATRMVMRSIATNPKVGQNLIFAIKAGARPEAYAPMIGQLVRDSQ